MQVPVIAFDDISLILAINAFFLLVVSELASPYLGLTNLVMNKKRLRNTSLVLSAAFFGTFILKIAGFVI